MLLKDECNKWQSLNEEISLYNTQSPADKEAPIKRDFLALRTLALVEILRKLHSHGTQTHRSSPAPWIQHAKHSGHMMAGIYRTHDGAYLTVPRHTEAWVTLEKSVLGSGKKNTFRYNKNILGISFFQARALLRDFMFFLSFFLFAVVQHFPLLIYPFCFFNVEPLFLVTCWEFFRYEFTSVRSWSPALCFRFLFSSRSPYLFHSFP